MPALKATLNCDMGEGYAGGMYQVGDDKALMPLIDLANVACGFHASDFSTMATAVKLAKRCGVKVGAHPSLPDRQGFGRREMKITPEEASDMITYQTGAIVGFLQREGVPLNHIKPHGALYGMSSKDLEIARASAKVAKQFGVPLMGVAGTKHQEAADELGVPFIAEWFADLNYDDQGNLLITKTHDPVTEEEVVRRTNRLLGEGLVTTISGTRPLGKGLHEVSICVHSDSPDAVETAKVIRKLVDDNNSS